MLQCISGSYVLLHKLSRMLRVVPGVLLAGVFVLAIGVPCCLLPCCMLTVRVGRVGVFWRAVLFVFVCGFQAWRVGRVGHACWACLFIVAWLAWLLVTISLPNPRIHVFACLSLGQPCCGGSPIRIENGCFSYKRLIKNPCC